MRHRINDSFVNLTDEFYRLIDDGYIYEEDENRRNMSYGEYAAIADYLWGFVEDEVAKCNDFEDAYDTYIQIIETADL